MTIRYEDGVGQRILNSIAESDDRFTGMTMWGDDVTRVFTDIGLCSIDMCHILRDLEDVREIKFPDNVQEIASSPLELLALVVELLNERSAP